MVASSGSLMMIVGAALTTARRRVMVAAGWGAVVAGFLATVGGLTKLNRC